MSLSIVTGGGGVLGHAIVKALLDRGDTVVAVDRHAEALESLPGDVTREVGDLSDPASVDALFDRVASTAGTPSAVVHTVGMFRGGAAADSTPDDYRLLMDVNLHAAWWVTRAAARVMRDAGAGSIVVVAARQGLEATAGAAAYSLTKAAVVHLTRVLDAELRPAHVRVNAIVPSLIDTPANRASIPAEVMKRAVAPEAIAKVVAWLVGDDAAPVVGAIVPVYGTG